MDRKTPDKNTIECFYTSDKFLESNIYHDVDSPWKAEQIKPLIDILLSKETSKNITVLDIGGGSGLVAKEILEYIQTRHLREVRLLAVDLSPGYLELHKKNNPSLEAAYCTSIESTPLSKKEVDIALMVDVLEHVHDTIACYKELRRIAKYTILKVPLESNMTTVILNAIIGYNKMRRVSVGHVNFFNAKSLKKEIEDNLGCVLSFSFTDVFSYLLRSVRRKTLSLPKVAYCKIAKMFFRISPRFTSHLFYNFAVLLVKCR